MNNAPGNAAAALQHAQSVAVLTGAGISAESGIPTFRGAAGVWRNYRPEELATPHAYTRDPLLVWDWYKMRLATVLRAKPNVAHRALATLEHTKDLTLVTQNVDGLHRRAGSTRLLELHGDISYSRCERCGQLDRLGADFAIPPLCSSCGSRARPNVVWFGEPLPQAILARAIDAFTSAEFALIIGTSGVVEPAASLARLAKDRGAFVAEINPEPTPLSDLADLSLRLDAANGLRALRMG